MISYIAIGLQVQIFNRGSRKQLLARRPRARLICETKPKNTAPRLRDWFGLRRKSKLAPLQLRPDVNPRTGIFQWEMVFVESGLSSVAEHFAVSPSKPISIPPPGIVVEEPDFGLLEGCLDMHQSQGGIAPQLPPLLSSAGSWVYLGCLAR